MVSTGLGCAAGFASSILLGRLTGFCRVTEAYGCKLRKGLFADELVLGVVDTFWACFFFFLLLCVIHGFASTIDYILYLVRPALALGRLNTVRWSCRLKYTVSIWPALSLECTVSVDGVAGRYILLSDVVSFDGVVSDFGQLWRLVD